MKSLFKNKWFYIISIPLFILLLIVVILFIVFPRIKLNGKSEVNVKVYTEYKDKGYSASFLGKDISKNVKVTNNVNTKKIGQYKVKYNLVYKGMTSKKVRIVNVVDSEAPIITLDGNSTICSNKTYKEEGYKAVDNYDGDITDKVKLNIADDHIEYIAKDSSNNETKITRTINIIKSDPVITLKSSDNITVYQNDNYNEPGWNITDKCENESEFKVNISGSVDTSKIGTYTLKYTVEGSKSSVERTVRVIARPSFTSNVIYLTFDDGPSNVTLQILNVLKEENVKATFFVIDNGRDLDYIIKRAYDEGHTIALHTKSHNYSYIYASEENFFNDLVSIQNTVKNITGYDSHIFRFPGGASNMVSRFNPGIMSRLSVETVNRGYYYFDWNVDSNDAGGATTSDAIYRNVVNNLSPNRANVVLMHDAGTKQATANALKDIIRYGKNNGYNFDKLTESSSPVRHHVNN